jgi:TATA-binding protein-associated factor Taf7
MSKPVTEYYEHKYPAEAVPFDVDKVLNEVNELQRRLTHTEQHNRLMRESINEIGQYLCEVSHHLSEHVTDTRLKLQFKGVL